MLAHVLNAHEYAMTGATYGCYSSRQSCGAVVLGVATQVLVL